MKHNSETSSIDVVPVGPSPALYASLALVAVVAALLIWLFPGGRQCRFCGRTSGQTAFPKIGRIPAGFPEDVCWDCLEDALRWPEEDAKEAASPELPEP